MIRVSEHRELLHRMLQDYGLTSEALEIVPDVLGWCRENGIEESNPFRTAKCFCHWADGTCHIVLVEKISAEQISSAKNAVECDGLVQEVRGPRTDRQYLVHLSFTNWAAMC